MHNIINLYYIISNCTCVVWRVNQQSRDLSVYFEWVHASVSLCVFWQKRIWFLIVCLCVCVCLRAHDGCLLQIKRSILKVSRTSINDVLSIIHRVRASRNGVSTHNPHKYVWLELFCCWRFYAVCVYVCVCVCACARVMYIRVCVYVYVFSQACSRSYL